VPVGSFAVATERTREKLTRCSRMPEVRRSRGKIKVISAIRLAV
jgi:hypothetical protein